MKLTILPCLFGILAASRALAQTPAAAPDLADYRTVESAIVSRQSLAGPGRAGLVGYLGVTVARDAKGRPMIADVQPDSPGAKAGLKSGDLLVRFAGQPVVSADTVRELLLSQGPGDEVKVAILRNEQPQELTAKLTALSKPMKLGTERVFLGVTLGEAKENDGAPIERIVPESPAAAAGLKVGDILVKINGENLNRASELSDAIAERKAGDILTITLRRENKDTDVKVTLQADRGQAARSGFGFGRGESPQPITLWKKDVFRVGVIPIEFPDTKHNEKIPLAEWEQALFSRNVYTNKNNATDQPVFGSLNDYFQEQSQGALRIEGKVFNWVEVGKKRGDYSQGSGVSNRTALPVEALDKLLARDGKDALKDFDGLMFIYAGDRIRTNAGAVYYPHTSSLFHREQNKRWNYVLTSEGGSRMLTLTGCAKEFAQLLGLPSLAARTENIGSEGLGSWCLLSNANTTGRPQHLCAWAKEHISWLKPTVIDPNVKQKLILAPIEDSPKECFKVLVRPDGSEYFLLENRQKKGFDTELPGAGLVIWRVVNDRPILEESHGIEGPTGPRVQVEHVPYPSPANNAFTPQTTPSSASLRGGGLPVHITEIRRLADGRIAFQIGYEYR